MLRRLDLTSRTIVALLEEGSCFAGTLAELVLAADQSFMLDVDNGPTLVLGEANLGWYPMANGHLASRRLGSGAATTNGRPPRG